jgi:RimJ/RimL family protein N-acetyltransferase
MRVIGETQRLVVREWTAGRGDVDRSYDTYRREEVTKWLGNPHPLTDPQQALTAVNRRLAMYEEHQGSYGVWAVERKDDGVVAGSVLLVPLPEPSDGSPDEGEVEIGWHLHPDSWGHGYATEAAKVVLAHGFRLGLDEILAIVKPDNEPSLAVARRLGMRHTGRTNRWYGIEAELFRRRPQ